MKKGSNLRPYLIRLGFITLISLIFAFAFNEVTYRIQKEPTDRAPETIQLVIPAGTAEKIAAGESVPSIPEEMVFVIGDTLEVVNQDSVSHQLGPIWVPAGSTGSLVMNAVEHVRYSCSFQTQQYLGLETKAPTTFLTRMAALFLTVPTLAVVLFLFSVAQYPIKQPTGVSKERAAV
jgi:hypothetical protein